MQNKKLDLDGEIDRYSRVKNAADDELTALINSTDVPAGWWNNPEGWMQSLATAAPAGEDLDVVVELTTDPLENWRSMLNSGAVLQEWVKGKPQSRHVLIADDMLSIILKDTNKKVKRGLMMPLKSVKSIEKGLGKGHKKKKMLGKKADEKCAFNIIGMHDEVISLCTNNGGDAKHWVEALETLVDTFKNHRKWLVRHYYLYEWRWWMLEG
jgi:hypothetical protein